MLSYGSMYVIVVREEKIMSDSINPVGTQNIDTDRLILRPFVYEDAEVMFRNWASDKEVQHGYGEPVYNTLGEVQELLAKVIDKYSDKYFYRWVITLRDTGECIGMAAYFLVDKNNNFGEIEYCIGSAFQGKGYATEACKAVIRYGFEKIGFNRVQICCRPANKASNKVIDKCGFTYEGTLRDFFYRDGKYEGRKYFSILRSEYKG